MLGMGISNRNNTKLARATEAERPKIFLLLL
jgi:hypothetical protein